MYEKDVQKHLCPVSICSANSSWLKLPFPTKENKSLSGDDGLRIVGLPFKIGCACVLFCGILKTEARTYQFACLQRSQFSL